MMVDMEGFIPRLKTKQKFSTTETALNSMKMLDLRRSNSLVDKSCDYMEKILRNEIDWPDGFEKSMVQICSTLFVATKLSIFVQIAWSLRTFSIAGMLF